MHLVAASLKPANDSVWQFAQWFTIVQAKLRPEALPRVLFLVTGKGPQREAFRQRMRGMDLRRVAFRTLWLEAADYPLLLGSCDLGVCLHTSSSGVDLPMKVTQQHIFLRLPYLQQSCRMLGATAHRCVLRSVEAEGMCLSFHVIISA